ncbi:MAG: DUF4271 domain-containing protein [Rikenellaceae bacterium]|nr:DUF4271 domain-containing protein [Rikenellaceae bacterium]
MHDSLLNITQTDTLVTRNVLPVECADSVFVGSVRVLAERVDMSLSALDALMLSPVTQAVMLVVVLAYLLILCRRYGEAVEMSSWLIFPSLTPICESHSDWRFGLPWRVLGLFSMGVVATMLFYRVWDVSLALHPALVLGVVAIMVVLAWSLQWLVLKIVAEAVLQQRFVAMLASVRRFSVEMVGVWMTPLVVGCVLSSGGVAEVLWWVVLIVSAILVLINSLKILNLFVVARFSIFYWILYLCAVEFLTVSLAVVVTLRLL